MSDYEATIERDLEAIDTALGSGTATHEDPLARELQELALALQADSPEPDPEFAERMGERARAGFPEDGRPSGARRLAGAGRSLRTRWADSPVRLREALPGLAFAATLLIALVVVVSLAGKGPGGNDEDSGGADGGSVMQPGDSGGGGGGAVESEADALSQPPTQAQAGRGSGGLAVPPSTGGGFAPERSRRRIERSVSLELEAPVDEMARVAEQLTSVTGRYGGFVLSSSLSTGGDDAGGDFELRIPATQLRAALRELSALATVRSQSQNGRDVTREFVTSRDRLASARAERRSLLRRLEVAQTDEQAEALRVRLDLVAREINGLRGSLRDLRLRTDYAVVNVSLESGSGDAEGGGAGGSLDDALGDAGDLLVGTAGVLIRVLALALPLGVLALGAWLAGRSFRRRRRESVLA